METLIRPETTGADISDQDKAEALISLLDEYIDYLEHKVENLPISDVSGSLHSDSEKLLKKCFAELREKMIRNEEKYGYSNEWLTHDWEEECRNELKRHLDKGDPKDVAIYAMFMMYRGWSSNER